MGKACWEASQEGAERSPLPLGKQGPSKVRPCHRAGGGLFSFRGLSCPRAPLARAPGSLGEGELAEPCLA